MSEISTQILDEITQLKAALSKAKLHATRSSQALKAYEEQFAALDNATQELRNALADISTAASADEKQSAELRALRAEQEGMRAELAALYVALQATQGGE